MAVIFSFNGWKRKKKKKYNIFHSFIAGPYFINKYKYVHQSSYVNPMFLRQHSYAT